MRMFKWWQFLIISTLGMLFAIWRKGFDLVPCLIVVVLIVVMTAVTYWAEQRIKSGKAS